MALICRGILAAENDWGLQPKISFSRLDLFCVPWARYCKGLLNKSWVISQNTQCSLVFCGKPALWNYYHHFKKLEGMYNAAWVKSQLSGDFTVYTYSAGVYGCYYERLYLFIYILPSPLCGCEHTAVMDLWMCMCTHAHASVHTCTCCTCLHV